MNSLQIVHQLSIWIWMLKICVITRTECVKVSEGITHDYEALICCNVLQHNVSPSKWTIIRVIGLSSPLWSVHVNWSGGKVYKVRPVIDETRNEEGMVETWRYRWAEGRRLQVIATMPVMAWAPARTLTMPVSGSNLIVDKHCFAENKILELVWLLRMAICDQWSSECATEQLRHKNGACRVIHRNISWGERRPRNKGFQLNCMCVCLGRVV